MFTREPESFIGFQGSRLEVLSLKYLHLEL
jgi:hypothetical protein